MVRRRRLGAASNHEMCGPSFETRPRAAPQDEVVLTQ
jgi:hypothetical protein